MTLNRNVPIDAGRELWNGLNETQRRPSLAPDASLAFGFDTNAVFRLGLGGTRGANAVDFIGQYAGPVILPGQAVQEIWNNALSGVEPKAKRLRARLDALEEEMTSVDQQMGPTGEAAKDALERLIESHRDWIDPKSQETFDGALEALLRVAKVPFVPRREFYELARIRKDTKTPPGFRDTGGNHGDFFVWADFLYGLALADLSGCQGVVFVTNDAKADWSRNGVIHPVLAAEAEALTGLPFRLWSLSAFQGYADDLLS